MIDRKKVRQLSKNKYFKKFVKERLKKREPEPFCPFRFSGYCNDAYSSRCLKCWASVDEYYCLTER